MKKALPLALAVAALLALSACDRLPGFQRDKSPSSPAAPAAPAVADFSWFQSSTTTIVFSNRSQGAVSYHWRFGDGVESSDTNPTHLFQHVGTYQVRLDATNRDGAQASVERSVTVL